ncbi:MAG: dephospho-CoA kinase [Oscillospiraceae bacterium]
MSEKGKIVAITGQSGCGKSTLSGLFSLKGYTVIDCDKVAKSVHNIEECKDKLAEFFGGDIIVEGKIDTALLSQKAFADEKSLQGLTDITHPFIISEILAKSQGAFERGEKLVFVDGAVIIGHDFEKYCDKFIVVVASFEKQCERLIKRDSLTIEQVKNRISRQTTYSEMLKKADYVINNNTTPTGLIVQGEFVLKQLLSV